MRKKRAQRLVSTADSVSVAPTREPVLGIDFGGLYSSAAVCVDGRVSFALDGGDAAIPTMVYVPASGPLVVGKEALRLGFSDPFNVVTSVNRLLGLGWGDPALRALDAGSSFALHQGPCGQVLIRIQKQELAPVQLAAAVLARLRKLAEARFDELDEAPEFISTADLAGVFDFDAAWLGRRLAELGCSPPASG